MRVRPGRGQALSSGGNAPQGRRNFSTDCAAPAPVRRYLLRTDERARPATKDSYPALSVNIKTLKP